MDLAVQRMTIEGQDRVSGISSYDNISFETGFLFNFQSGQIKTFFKTDAKQWQSENLKFSEENKQLGAVATLSY